jgi:hypothetical protein
VTIAPAPARTITPEPGVSPLARQTVPGPNTPAHTAPTAAAGGGVGTGGAMSRQTRDRGEQDVASRGSRPPGPVRAAAPGQLRVGGSATGTPLLGPSADVPRGGGGQLPQKAPAAGTRNAPSCCALLQPFPQAFNASRRPGAGTRDRLRPAGSLPWLARPLQPLRTTALREQTPGHRVARGRHAGPCGAKVPSTPCASMVTRIEPAHKGGSPR